MPSRIARPHPTPKRRRGSLALAGILALGALGGAPAAVVLGVDDCSLASSTLTVDAAPDEGLTSLFADYATEKRWWTGGDSTYSVALDKARTGWLFSDTLLGKVEDDGSQAIDFFVNSSLLVQKGDHLVRTVTGGTPAKPTGLLPPEEHAWYWLGASQLTDDGSTLDVLHPRFAAFPPFGQWDWSWDRTVLARYDASSFKLQSVHEVASAHGITWASWLSRDGDHTFIYGVEDLGLVKYMHLARVAGDDLTSAWEFWTGSGWSDAEADSARIMSGVGNEYSVAPYGDGYLLVTQNTNELFSRDIVAYTGCSPEGPFTLAATLYQTPETGLFGSYGNPNIFTYNAHEHPDLRDGSTLLVTYNVNSFDNQDLYRDATIYRPRFIRVTLSGD